MAACGVAEFAGIWQIGRAISDLRAGRAGRFDGQALLTPCDGGLDYAETGLLTLGDGPPLAATRRYRWQFDGVRVAVSFPDGRPFHDFVPGVDGRGTEHQCGDDLYRVRYTWMPGPEWLAVWDVEGPRKSYRLDSLYRRA